jgi:hypothetical protein
VSGWSWFAYTNSSAADIRSELLNNINKENDVLIIIKVDPGEFDGWAPKWVWDWLADRTGTEAPAGGAASALSGLPSPFSPKNPLA